MSTVQSQTTKGLLPGVTVCIATHPERQTSGLINRAFASVAAQTLQPAVVVVANDRERLGAGATRRRLLAAVDTEWIAWLDSDDEWAPEHLEKLFQVATETDSVYVFSWFFGNDPLGHFGLPFNPCTPHHTTMNVLVRTDVAREVGFNLNEVGPFANEDWGFITGVAKLACERGLKMTHLAERTWTYHQHGQNSSGQPGQGDARGA
jgi:glycosyltransferase involved in cell wall biosynthesis